MRATTLAVLAALLTAPAAADPPPAQSPPPDILSYYPAAAKAAGVSGQATLSCERTEHGGYANCSIVSETPPSFGFGGAALKLAADARQDPAERLNDALRARRNITFVFALSPPSIQPDVIHAARWVISRPSWVRTPGPGDFARIYPRAAAARGLGGRVVMKCVVTATGSMSQCRVESEEPQGYGFGDAALELAQRFKMSSKTDTGIPVGGATITIPIRFMTSP